MSQTKTLTRPIAFVLLAATLAVAAPAAADTPCGPTVTSLDVLAGSEAGPGAEATFGSVVRFTLEGCAPDGITIVSYGAANATAAIDAVVALDAEGTHEIAIELPCSFGIDILAAADADAGSDLDTARATAGVLASISGDLGCTDDESADDGGDGGTDDGTDDGGDGGDGGTDDGGDGRDDGGDGRDDGGDGGICVDLSADAHAAGGIRLAVDSDVDSNMLLYRAAGDGELELLGGLDASVRSFLDTEVEAGTAYTYVATTMEADASMCTGVEVTAVPTFPTEVAGALALGIGLVGYAASRRRS